jgi:UDP-N-acetylmuramyl tripeptide synthase
LSFRMDVRVEKVLKDGAYDAKLVNVEQKETKFGDRLMWTFEVAEENTEVVGFTSMSPSMKAKAYQWAAAIAGEIDPKLGWGPEDLIGGKCVVVLEAAEDAQGTEKNKVVKVKPLRKSEAATAETASESDTPEKGFKLLSS